MQEFEVLAAVCIASPSCRAAEVASLIQVGVVLSLSLLLAAIAQVSLINQLVWRSSTTCQPREPSLKVVADVVHAVLHEDRRPRGLGFVLGRVHGDGGENVGVGLCRLHQRPRQRVPLSIIQILQKGWTRQKKKDEEEQHTV